MQPSECLLCQILREVMVVEQEIREPDERCAALFDVALER
jgi:hypothetical protein